VLPHANHGVPAYLGCTAAAVMHNCNKTPLS
jgi:hypothetical protein